MRMIWSRRRCAALVALTSCSLSAHATLLQYEGFSYTAGANALNGKNGGGGFTSTWSNAGADVVSGSFSYTDGNGKALPTAGNRAFIDSTTVGDSSTTGTSVAPIRTMTAPSSSLNTLYISFLAQQTDAGTSQRDISVALFTSATDSTNTDFGTAERLTIGHGNFHDTWGAYALGDGEKGGYSTVSSASLAFL